MWFASRIYRRKAGRKLMRMDRFRPVLENLEDRSLPSTLMVLNNLDSGAGSLRDAINNANSGDTVVFAPSLDGQTICLTSDQLTIDNSIDIEGPGTGLLAISGNDKNRVFNINEGLTVTIAGHKIVYRDVYQYCSQWSNVRGSLHAEKAYVIDRTYTIGTPDASYWDGNNTQHAYTSETYSSTWKDGSIDPESELLTEAPSNVIREIARELPAFLADYAKEMTLAAEENTRLAESLPDLKG